MKRLMPALLLLSAIILPSFGNLVGHVVCMGSQKEMHRIDARRIIAPMQDMQTGVDRPDEQFVGDAVGVEVAAVAGCNGSISLPMTASIPQNASAWRFLADILPKPNFQRFTSCETKTSDGTKNGSADVARRPGKPLAADFADARQSWSILAGHAESPQKVQGVGAGVLEHVCSAILVALTDEKKVDPPPAIRLPLGPIVPTPPVPVPSPLTPTVLTSDLLFVIDSDVPCLIRTSPAGLVDIAADTGPIKIRGKFVDGSGKSETRTYSGKHVYIITAAQTGKCELIIFPIGATKDSDIISRLLDCQLAPLPPPIPPAPPDPPQPPEPPDPFSGMKGMADDGSPAFRVLIVYDKANLTSIPVAQHDLLYSDALRSYLTSHCVKDAKGLAAWRVYDASTDMTNEVDVWKRAMAKAKLQTHPYLMIGNGKTGYAGPLPATLDDTMKLFAKFAPP